MQADLLFRDGQPLPLGRRATALLRTLTDRPGAVVAKDALMDAAWLGQAVEENNLTVQIAALRRVLGAVPGGDHWIETMPRRGYRFIGPVCPEAQVSLEPSPEVGPAPELAPPAPRKHAERRQITAVSCELTGNARRTDGMDLEDWHEAVDWFRRCVSGTIARHNGFIASNVGNTVLVLFGYPAAHEHDVERAVRAGLEVSAAARTLRPAVDAAMRCRVGVATGMAIVGELGRAGDPEIIGATADLAVRLRTSAEPDMVAIDRTTQQLIGNLFDCRVLGATEADRSGEPMPRWQVLAERTVESRFEALRGPMLSPLIGRDEEVDLLLRRWTRAKAGDGQVVLVSGEPGIGKSRMAAVLAERLQDEPHLRLTYFCSPDHQASPLHPFIEQLGRAARFSREDPPAVQQEKLEGLLVAAASTDEEVALLADLLSLPASERHLLPDLSPQRKKERTLAALIRQLERLAGAQRVVMVIEDAHWIDPTSRELLDLTVERIGSLAVLLIVTFRPELRPPWTGLPHVTMLVLKRLERSDRIALVAQVAGDKALPDDLIDQIVDRTDGVPLFVEELTKSILESGHLREEGNRYVLDRTLPTRAIPASLRASLAARLDRSAPGRRVAQIGAAIGREFRYALLRDVSHLADDELQAAVADLVASELVFQRGAPPEAVYSFKHALVQDAAHDSLLRDARRQLHAQIAEVLTTQYPELMDNQPEIFAQHYAEAGLIEQSVAYWAKAGRRSAARSAMAEAAAQFQKALDQLALLPDNLARQRQELEFRSSLGEVLRFVKGMSSPEVSRAFARARELWARIGSPSEFLHIPYWQSRNHQNHGELALAQRSDEDLLRLSLQRNDPAGLVVGHLSSARTLIYAGNFASSRSHLEAVLALYDPVAHRSRVRQAAIHPEITSRAYLGNVLFFLGFPDKGLAQSNAAIIEARRLAHTSSLAGVLLTAARLLSIVGDDPALDERASELVAVATEQGWPPWAAQATIYRGWLKARKGDLTEGILLLRSGSAAYRAIGAKLLMPHHLALLARACEIAGQVEEALTLLDDALRATERTGERWLTAELYRHKGELLLRQGHTEAADELYRKAVSIAQEQEAKLWELRAAASLARLRRDQGRHPEARNLLAPVYSWFTEGFATPDLKEAKALLDELI
jgi:predicted ATPase/DNA-binding winged helix-turn-helix (wHTH) protein